MSTKTVTIGAGEWVYVDKNSTEHTVTTNQTFTFELTDTSSTNVTFSIDEAQSVTTTDGYVINIRTENISNTSTGGPRNIGPMADTMDAVATTGIAGEMFCECPVTGIIQRWVPASININDIDTPTEWTEMKFEDQFGNKTEILTAAVA